MTIVIGLTGSIATGKSTVLKQFSQLGAQTSSADKIVHELYRDDPEIISNIHKHFPNVVKRGKINLKELGEEAFADKEKLTLLESWLHPKVRAKHMEKIEEARRAKVSVLVLEIPLLFETGAEVMCDKIVVVTVTIGIQRQRALARKGMTEEKFQSILSRQMRDQKKRARADFIINTANGMDSSYAQVEALMSRL